MAFAQPPPKNRLGATGELVRPYRRIAWGLQENCLGGTGESAAVLRQGLH